MFAQIYVEIDCLWRRAGADAQIRHTPPRLGFEIRLSLRRRYDAHHFLRFVEIVGDRWVTNMAPFALDTRG